ncbi:hypothetical protein GBAR_LOCUS12488 [Geodia barretti]|uniref:Death domain-containing protein n=1 Tax=Geodia barretti TaxID=519541 RepID=A0AA35S2F7_GEOBA|nr:hypothetical protein GBAR_LOCUS12488 [Geodia barretti]
MVLLAITCMAEQGQMEIGILNGFSSTLRYLNGNCSWRVTTIAAGNEVEVELSVGPLTTLVGGDGGTDDDFTLKCITEEGEQLNAIIVTHTLETIPQPTIIALDYETGILDWSHPFHPDLPVDFEIIHQFRVVYLVNETDRERDKSSLFRLWSMTSSTVSLSRSFMTPKFHFLSHLSAMFEDSSNPLRVQVMFHLAAKVCLSQFTIVIYGVANVSFNVTRAEAAKGTVIYDLPSHISPMDVCDVQSEIYGGNVIGNSNSFSILVPEACLPSTPETLSTAEGRPSTSSSPPPVETKQSDIPPGVIGSVAAIVVLLVSLFLAIAVICLVVHRRRRARECSSEDPPASPRQSYCVVEPRTGASEKKLFSINPTSEYADIDHVETERVRQQLEQAKAASTLSSDEAAVGTHSEISIEPAISGLSLEAHYDLLLAVLLPVKARWFELGMKLNLSENFLDETEANMDSVEECLGEMLQNWLLYHDPTMETLNNALSRMKLSPITFDTTSSKFVG